MANARVTWHGAAEAANREVETVAKAVADAGAKAVWSGGRCGVGQRRRRGQAGGGREGGWGWLRSKVAMRGR